MNTLKEIIGILQKIGITISGLTFSILMIKIVTDSENKPKYIKYSKNLIIATILLMLSLTFIEIPKSYFGSLIEITDNIHEEVTFSQIKDEDCQGRETIKIDGKWYVVTDTNEKLGALTDDSKIAIVTQFGLYSTDKVLEGVSLLKSFSECQGTFKGFFAETIYYRDSDGFIFPTSYTYAQYTNAKLEGGNQ